MQVYVGGDNHASTSEWLRKTGFGQMKSVNFFQRPAAGTCWAMDNGAFTLFLRGTSERYEAGMAKPFLRVMDRVIAGDFPAPDFTILPDIVASKASLNLSLRWLDRLPVSATPYLAVQDGMGLQRVKAVLRGEKRIRGLFVGGTVPWKHRTAGSWANLAHEHDIPCHVGRIGMPHDIFSMIAAGVDSIDSTSWARHRTYGYIRQAFEMWADATGRVLPVLRRLRRLPLPI